MQPRYFAAALPSPRTVSPFAAASRYAQTHRRRAALLRQDKTPPAADGTHVLFLTCCLARLSVRGRDMLVALAQSLFHRVTLVLRYLMGSGGAGGPDAGRPTPALAQDEDAWSPELVDPLSQPNDMLKSRESRCAPKAAALTGREAAEEPSIKRAGGVTSKRCTPSTHGRTSCPSPDIPSSFASQTHLPRCFETAATRTLPHLLTRSLATTAGSSLLARLHGARGALQDNRAWSDA